MPDLTEVRHMSERVLHRSPPRRSMAARPTPWRIVRNVGLGLWFGASVLEARTPHEMPQMPDPEAERGPRDPSPDRRDRKKSMLREAHAEEVLVEYQHRVQRTWTPVMAAGAALTVIGGAGVALTGGRYSQSPPIPIGIIAAAALGVTVAAAMMREQSLTMWEQQLAGGVDSKAQRRTQAALRVAEPLVPVMTGSLLVAATVDG